MFPCAFVCSGIVCVGIWNVRQVRQRSVCFVSIIRGKIFPLPTPSIERSLRYDIKPNITHLFPNISNFTHKIALFTNALEGIISRWR